MAKFLRVQQYASLATPNIKKEILLNLDNVIYFEKFTGRPYDGKIIAYVKDEEPLYLAVSFDELTKGKVDFIEFDVE